MRGEAAFLWVRNDLSKFQVFTTGGIDLAVAAAQNWPRRGHTVRQTIDGLIATFCLEAGHRFCIVIAISILWIIPDRRFLAQD